MKPHARWIAPIRRLVRPASVSGVPQRVTAQPRARFRGARCDILGLDSGAVILPGTPGPRAGARR